MMKTIKQIKVARWEFIYNTKQNIYVKIVIKFMKYSAHLDILAETH